MTGIRRVTALASRNPCFPSVRPQVRGKKKLAKHAPIKVRLLTDVAHYGREGILQKPMNWKLQCKGEKLLTANRICDINCGGTNAQSLIPTKYGRVCNEGSAS
jgi:hypothetical protein